MTHSTLKHLRDLASFRGLELAQSIRLARMQLAPDSRTVGTLTDEKSRNDAALAELEAQLRVAA